MPTFAAAAAVRWALAAGTRSPYASPHELREPHAVGDSVVLRHGNDEPTASELRDLHEKQRVQRAEPLSTEADGELVHGVHSNAAPVGRSRSTTSAREWSCRRSAALWRSRARAEGSVLTVEQS